MRPALLLLACGLAHAQTFDAASVKPAAPLGRPVRPTVDPGRIHYPGTTVQSLILMAYDASVFEILGPGWLDSEKFDVDATMPAATTREQLHLSLGSGRIPVSSGPEGAAPPDIFSALQEQLGLKLESRKVPASMLVIDRIVKTPTGN